jgi:protein TonB
MGRLMRKYTLLLSVTVHVVAALALVIAPLFAAAKLPLVRDAISFVPVTVAPPPPALGGGSPRHTAQPTPARADIVPLKAPASLPPDNEPSVPDLNIGSSDPGPVGPIGPIGPGVPWGVVGGLIERPAPPPVTPPPAIVHEPVRVGRGVIPPKKIREVAPIYPPIAVAARREGLVILEAVIAEDGSVRDVKVLRSVPLLDQAAMEAVRQWRFTPTLLSGEPVPVVMTVTVDFKLN